MTFNTICSQYLSYLRGRYDNTVVVFDGYDQGPSTKDITHYRRSNGGVGTKVKFEYSTPFRSKKEIFLRNQGNKQAFVKLLGEFLRQEGITVMYAPGDADTLIVETAITSADTNVTYVIGEDTDLLVLLINRVADHHTIYFKSDTRQSLTHLRKIWNIKKTRKVLGNNTCRLLPFLHALTGCDTTSRIFGIGKAVALRVLRTNTKFQETGIQFLSSSSKDDIVELGERALAILIDGDPYVRLDALRFRKFAAKVMTSTVFVQVHILPPTSAAAAYHSLRVYLQCRQWMGDSSLRPEDFGWELKDGTYIPIKTDLPPAPENLLNIIRCNCKVNCDTRRCTCRKHGLECSVGCGACRGVSCSNSMTLAEVEAEERAE
ncbi:uncharacterized protein LOC123527311 isoform X1 [Mercenaria mercenaria]|uniref:uncharacterized protein LOC123527311 isoform X1 n=1 Tax=Mercenaria mercenaria TaxID=6596 RepID=UPI00234F75E3|nr:uncharacterized protein LOC123527311 isoform X1 [Mercenaria mercenaria]